MGEARRRHRKRPESQMSSDEFDKPEKVEYEIAKYLRSHLPPKQTTLLGHKVDYFIANRAIDLLMKSKWAQVDKRTGESMFASRESAVHFMNIMLRHKFFHRAKAIIVKKEIKIRQETDSTDEGNKSESKKLMKNEKSSVKNSSKEETMITKKEKKKVKLDMHPEQIVVDSNEPYVWIYDYIPMKTWLIGGCLVIAAIAVCLFPLWPRTVRNYVYYLSIAVAVFLFFIIALALMKLVVFAMVWALTFGRHHFWILPNLTEDVGFLESFWPLYKHERKNDDDNDHNETSAETVANDDVQLNEDEKLIAEKDTEDEGDDDDDDDGGGGGGDSAEGEHNSGCNIEPQTNANNGFEMLDSNECQ